MRIAIASVTALLSVFVPAGCKKGEDPGAKASTAFAAAGSGFSDLYADELNTRGAGGIFGSAEVLDLTVEGSKLHLMYAGYVGATTASNAIPRRRTLDLGSGALIAQPEGADTVFNDFWLKNSDWTRGSSGFLPYRNVFTFSKSSSGGSGKSYTYFGGDLVYEWSRYVAMQPDLGYRFPVNNISGLAYGVGGVGAVGFAPLSAAPYTFKNCLPTEVVFTNNSHQHVAAVLLEGYRSSLQDSLFCISFRQDSIIAYTMSTGQDGKLSRFAMVAAIKNFEGVPAFGARNFIRHYNASGTKMSVALLNSRTCYAFSFDYSTYTLSRGAGNFELPDANPALVDVDEEGNIYYATAGSNGAGAAVYKRSSGGATSRIGGESILRYGQLVKVKYLSGKVYLSAYGVTEGSNYTRVAILRQE